MNFDLLKFYEEIKKDGIMFCYSGPISQSTVEGIGETLRINMKLEDAGINTANTVFSIFVEQMHNILNYSAERISQDSELEPKIGMGVLVIGRDENSFYIFCGNRLLNEDVQKLREKMESLRLLGKEELKAIYKQKRKESSDPDSKGAGLGLIDMARKAGKPIEYEFKPLDETYTFFSIKVVV